MSGLLSVARAQRLRAVVTSALPHTYSRTPRAVNTSNPDYETFADEATATGVACFYGTRSRGRREEIGKVVSNEPLFLADASDPIAAGDVVSNVREAAGTLLLAGPLIVLAVEPKAAAGIALARHVQLESAQAAPAVETG